MKPLALVLALAVTGGNLLAQAPDGNLVLRGAGVAVPRGGAIDAFDEGLTAPPPIPPGAFATLIVGMGPVGSIARARSAYAFGVLAGRSGRNASFGELNGAGIALVQMIVSSDRRSRIAGSRVAGRVFAAPIDGKPAPLRPAGLAEAMLLLLNGSPEAEQSAAIEGLGLLGEIAAIPAITEIYTRARAKNDRHLAGVALEALTRIGDAGSAPLVRDLATDPWGDRDDATGLVVAFARERYLKDGSVQRLQAAAEHRTLGPRARAYLAELGVPLP